MKKANPTRSDVNCTNCSKNFIAQLDMSLDGNHVVECPYCGHEHCRVVESGTVTSVRWDSRMQRIGVDKRCVWKSDSQPMMTSIASMYLREKWLNKLGAQS